MVQNTLNGVLFTFFRGELAEADIEDVSEFLLAYEYDMIQTLLKARAGESDAERNEDEIEEILAHCYARRCQDRHIKAKNNLRSYVPITRYSMEYLDTLMNAAENMT